MLLARIPLFLFQAVQAALLPRLARLAARNELAEFRLGFRKLMQIVVAVGVLGTAGEYVLGPWIVQKMYAVDLSRRTMAMLALGSALYMVALALAQAVIALQGHALVAVGWSVGMGTFLVVTWLSSDDLFERVELGLVVSSLRRARRVHAGAAQPSVDGDRADGGLAARGPHGHAVRDVAGRLPRQPRRSFSLSMRRSLSTIIFTSVGKSTSGVQPSLVRAFVESPISRSTSAGR